MDTSQNQKKVLILVADDDEDDQLFTREAFEDSNLPIELRFVNDGVELLDYLRRQNNYENTAENPMPALILLDLNMPRMDGREALKEIKSDTALKSIPIIALTTSKTEQEILKSYELGINSFVTKPVTLAAFVEMAKLLGHYWIDLVKLPSHTQR